MGADRKLREVSFESLVDACERQRTNDAEKLRVYEETLLRIASAELSDCAEARRALDRFTIDLLSITSVDDACRNDQYSGRSTGQPTPGNGEDGLDNGRLATRAASESSPASNRDVCTCTFGNEPKGCRVHDSNIQDANLSMAYSAAVIHRSEVREGTLTGYLGERVAVHIPEAQWRKLAAAICAITGGDIV